MFVVQNAHTHVHAHTHTHKPDLLSVCKLSIPFLPFFCLCEFIFLAGSNFTVAWQIVPCLLLFPLRWQKPVTLRKFPWAELVVAARENTCLQKKKSLKWFFETEKINASQLVWLQNHLLCWLSSLACWGIFRQLMSAFNLPPPDTLPSR